MYEQSIRLVDFLQGALTSVYMVLGSPSRKVTVPNYPAVQCSLRTVGHSVCLDTTCNFVPKSCACLVKSQPKVQCFNSPPYNRLTMK